mgnify:CR=1 FL=1
MRYVICKFGLEGVTIYEVFIFAWTRTKEYYQIHVDVLYIPTEENKDFQRTIWNEDIEEDIFSYIKKTPEFNFCKDKVFSKIEIYLDET